MRVATRPQQAFVAISSALLLLASINAAADAEPTPSRHAPSHEPNAVSDFAASLVRVDAATNARGTGSMRDPLYTIVGNKPNGANVHRCLVQPRASNPCSAVGPSPPVPNHSLPTCVHCDDAALARSWGVYTQKLMGAEALKRLHELHGHLRRRVPLSELGKLLREHVAREQTAAGAQARASASVLRDYAVANTDTELHDAAERSLQTVIEACGLGITPDDLATEGGLEAAVKLSEAMLKTSRNKWQKAFAAWTECLRSAASKAHLVRATAAEAKACNAGPRGRGDVRKHPEWKAVFDWQARRDAYDTCLNANQSHELVVVEYQVTPCPAGKAF